MTRPLYAGTFRVPPVRVQAMRTGSVMLVGADNQSCWSDRNGRFLLDSMGEAHTLLGVHRYTLHEDGSIVQMDSPPPPESPPAPTPSTRKPRRKKSDAGPTA